MADGDTCIKCGRPLQPTDYEMKLKLCERLGKPYSPPKVCGACVIATIMSWPDDEKENPDVD